MAGNGEHHADGRQATALHDAGTRRFDGDRNEVHRGGSDYASYRIWHHHNELTKQENK